jgi:hypothetical protein
MHFHPRQNSWQGKVVAVLVNPWFSSHRSLLQYLRHTVATSLYQIPLCLLAAGLLFYVTLYYTHWALRLRPSSGIKKLKKTAFRKLDLFASSDQSGETPALFVLLEGTTGTQHKPSLCLRHFVYTFVAWPHGPERLHNFLSDLNSLRPSIQFTAETDAAIHHLDVVITKKGTALASKVYRKPTHIGRYLNLKSNYPPRLKGGLIQGLHSRASTICQKDKISLVKLTSWDVIFSSTIIPKISLTPLLIPRVSVFWINRESLWALCVSNMWRVFQNCSNV